MKWIVIIGLFLFPIIFYQIVKIIGLMKEYWNQGDEFANWFCVPAAICWLIDLGVIIGVSL